MKTFREYLNEQMNESADNSLVISATGKLLNICKAGVLDDDKTNFLEMTKLYGISDLSFDKSSVTVTLDKTVEETVMKNKVKDEDALKAQITLDIIRYFG